MRDEHGSSQLHLRTIMQYLIHFRRRIEGCRHVAVLKVSLAARFDDRHVGVHDHVLRTSQRLDSMRSNAANEPRAVATQRRVGSICLLDRVAITASYSVSGAMSAPFGQATVLPSMKNRSK